MEKTKYNDGKDYLEDKYSNINLCENHQSVKMIAMCILELKESVDKLNDALNSVEIHGEERN